MGTTLGPGEARGQQSGSAPAVLPPKPNFENPHVWACCFVKGIHRNSPRCGEVLSTRCHHLATGCLQIHPGRYREGARDEERLPDKWQQVAPAISTSPASRGCGLLSYHCLSAHNVQLCSPRLTILDGHVLNSKNAYLSPDTGILLTFIKQRCQNLFMHSINSSYESSQPLASSKYRFWHLMSQK